MRNAAITKQNKKNGRQWINRSHGGVGGRSRWEESVGGGRSRRKEEGARRGGAGEEESIKRFWEEAVITHRGGSLWRILKESLKTRIRNSGRDSHCLILPTSWNLDGIPQRRRVPMSPEANYATILNGSCDGPRHNGEISGSNPPSLIQQPVVMEQMARKDPVESQGNTKTRSLRQGSFMAVRST